jgi:hypothetical protein
VPTPSPMALRTGVARKAYACFRLMAVLAVVGCATQGQFLDSKQALAMQTAVSRGQFEMNCPEATPTVISREVIQPALQGPFVNGIQRAEYTIGVSGCGKRTTFVVICPDGGEGCFGAGPGRFHDWQ